MTRVAAIDCGTNSIRLLVADVGDGPRGATLVDVHREMRVVRLGEGVDRTGRLQPGALDRTWSALVDYTAILRSSGADRVRMVATSATRDAINRQDFVDMVQSTLGQPPEVITGREEAELSFRGAVGDLNPANGPFLVVDIGGGSTELVVGTVSTGTGSTGTGSTGMGATGMGATGTGATGMTDTAGGTVQLAGAVSIDLGCVRITERVLHRDPPTPDDVATARGLARRQLQEALAQLPIERVRSMVAVSGTATTIAAAALGLTSYDPSRIHLSTVSNEQVAGATGFFLGATTAHRAALGYMHPGRVDVIGGGALILDTLIRLVDRRVPLSEITVSEHDILDGIALSLAS